MKYAKSTTLQALKELTALAGFFTCTMQWLHDAHLPRYS
jgi:hypothetical protein